MPWQRDSLATIRERVANDIEYRHSIVGLSVDAHTPGTGYTELAIVVAGTAHGLYGNQQWIADQIFVATADEDTIIRRAAELGIPRIEATFASGAVAITGNNTKTLAADVMMQTDTGVQYRTTSSGTIAAGTAQVTVIAMDPGAASNLAAGATLTLVNPVSEIDSTVTVVAPGIANGADIESMDRLRARLLDRLQEPPMGGKDYDYIAWAKAASVDVTRAWVFPHENGIGSIVVRFVAEDLADPIPDAALVTLVSAYMDTVRPSGLRSLTVAAPTAVPMDLVFTSLTDNTADVQAAVAAEVKDLIRRDYVPGGTLKLSRINEAISRATGESDHVITLTTDLTYTDSEFPTWGTPTWPGA